MYRVLDHSGTRGRNHYVKGDLFNMNKIRHFNKHEVIHFFLALYNEQDAYVRKNLGKHCVSSPIATSVLISQLRTIMIAFGCWIKTVTPIVDSVRE